LVAEASGRLKQRKTMSPQTRERHTTHSGKRNGCREGFPNLLPGKETTGKPEGRTHRKQRTPQRRRGSGGEKNLKRCPRDKLTDFKHTLGGQRIFPCGCCRTVVFGRWDAQKGACSILGRRKKTGCRGCVRSKVFHS